MDKLASFVKLPPLIPAKSPKEVNEVSKFFKKNSQPVKKKDARKSYTQISSLSTIMSEILKIKEIFLKLQVKKLKISKKSSMVIVSPSIN